MGYQSNVLESVLSRYEQKYCKPLPVSTSAIPFYDEYYKYFLFVKPSVWYVTVKNEKFRAAFQRENLQINFFYPNISIF